MVRKFHKKPLLIEAIQYTGENSGEVMKFVPDLERLPFQEKRGVPLRIPHKLGAWDGDWVAMKGDWIIKGTDQKFHTMPDKKFVQRYEEAEEDHTK